MFPIYSVAKWRKCPRFGSGSFISICVSWHFTASIFHFLNSRLIYIWHTLKPINRYHFRPPIAGDSGHSRPLILLAASAWRARIAAWSALRAVFGQPVRNRFHFTLHLPIGPADRRIHRTAGRSKPPIRGRLRWTLRSSPQRQQRGAQQHRPRVAPCLSRGSAPHPPDSLHDGLLFTSLTNFISMALCYHSV